MVEDTTLESQLRADIERLRKEFHDTPDLYREVCALLFFRYGVAPTANKLYQLVRKGSMTAPADALSKFWDELRRKSRLRIEHPDLPEDLRAAAGELTATLWGKAQALAHESLDAYRAESQGAVTLAQVDAEKSQQLHSEASHKADDLQAELHALQQIRESLERDLAAEWAAHTETRQHAAERLTQISDLQMALKEARAEFSIELEKLRGAMQLVEERAQAVERRALLEIDQERTQRSKAEQELDRARKTAAETDQRFRTEAAAIQREAAELRQENGKLEGRLSSVAQQLQSGEAQLQEVRQALNSAHGDVGIARGEAESLRKHIQELLSANEFLQAQLKEGQAKRSGSKKGKNTPVAEG